MAVSTVAYWSEQESQFQNRAGLLDPNEYGGRNRIAWFNYTVGSATHTEDTTIVGLCRIPAFARILKITGSITDLGTNVGIWLGVAATDSSGEIDSAATGDDTNFFNATVINGSSTGSYTAATLVADKQGYVTEKELTLTVLFSSTGGSATYATTGVIQGYVEYVVD